MESVSIARIISNMNQKQKDIFCNEMISEKLKDLAFTIQAELGGVSEVSVVVKFQDGNMATIWEYLVIQ